MNKDHLNKNDLNQLEMEYDFILPFNKNLHIVDIGCGVGLFLDFLKFKNYTNIIGIDSSLSQLEIARIKGHNVIHDDAENWLSVNKNIDIIIIFDVVEHMLKDEFINFLKLAKDSLNDNGLLIIRTINAASIYGGYSRYIDYTHEVSFTEISLKQILDASGYRDVTIKDNLISFGLKPKRFLRWIAFKILRSIQKFVFLIEVGVDSPKLFGKFLIVTAKK